MAGKPWYNNGDIEIQKGSWEEIPDGFVRGRLPLSDEKRKNISLSHSNKSKEQKDEENRKRSNSLKATYSKKSKEEIDSIIQKRKDAWAEKTDDEIAEYKRNLSASSKGKNVGKTPWNKGLTKETDERVFLNSKHTSKTNKEKASKIKENDPDFYTRWRQNINDVMRNNNSFNRSIAEDNYYKELVRKYGESDVIRWYSDERYPFVCDFYIPSKDLFIELNLHWTHGGHSFDELSLEDISKLENWKEMSKTSKYYLNAIYTWTVLDVKKQKTAKENHLNYEVIY